MHILSFPSGPFATNAYLAVCSTTGKAVIIDPAPGSGELISEQIRDNQWIPQAIWLTHSHWDHFGDALSLKNRWKIPLLVHSLDAPNLSRPGSDGLPIWGDISAVEPDQEIKEGDVLTVGNLAFRVLHTPGHSPGGVCFYCEGERVLFSGDTLFHNAMGNLSFPTSEPEKMGDSLERLSQLPKETGVYPGHGPETSIGQEPWIRDAKKLI